MAGLEILIDNALPEIRRVAEAVTAFCEREGLPPRIAANLSLALDELLTNTISYGYGYGEGERQTIAISLCLGPNALVTEVRDSAEAFNPLQDAPAPNLDLDLTDRQIGGLGIHIVKSLIDGSAYRYEDGCNIIVLTQDLPAPSGKRAGRGRKGGKSAC